MAELRGLQHLFTILISPVQEVQTTLSRVLWEAVVDLVSADAAARRRPLPVPS